jgi:hypothetical protein
MSEAGSQAENVTPAVKGEVVVITTDTTSRRYDLQTINIGNRREVNKGTLYLKMTAETADCFYYFSSDDAGTVDGTAAMSAGGAVAFTANAADRLVKDVPEHVRIEFPSHRYLCIRGAAAGILRIRASSHPTGW